MLVRTLRRIQSALSVTAPLAAAGAWAWRSWSTGFATRSTIAGGILFVLVITLAACLRKRAVGSETAWFDARIPKDPPGEENETVLFLSADVALVVATLFFLVAAVRHAAG